TIMRNRIAFNDSIYGALSVWSGSNVITENSIFSNRSHGIGLGYDGVTANDIGDADDGPNGLQNYPVVTTAHTANGVTNIHGTLNSLAGSRFRIEFFATPEASWSRQGENFLGSVDVITDKAGNASFLFQHSGAIA